jgi:CheY-like chemotaxis protein
MRRPLEILLVEDNPGDVFLFARALESGAPPCRLRTVANGKEAVDFLKKTGSYAEETRPDLVVLDLNLPLLSGREVLKKIKSDPALQEIPVVIFSSSSDPRDVHQSYQLQANAYLVKDAAADRFRDIVLALARFWSATSQTDEQS